ncbi:MAG: hypothetical protein EPO40_19465 [Myxococcaceae bacterium]|nr:MAG: hypothetical protein EPO40_19465 [Myxococcaceae bacterium]
MTLDADTSQRVSAEPVHAQRLTALERLTSDHATALTALDRHRERSETRWGLVALFVGAVAASGLGSAVVTRDTTRDNAQRLTMMERTLADQASDARASAAEGRGTHDAIVRLTATVDGLVHRVEELTTELHARDPDRASRPQPR